MQLRPTRYSTPLPPSRIVVLALILLRAGLFACVPPSSADFASSSLQLTLVLQRKVASVRFPHSSSLGTATPLVSCVFPRLFFFVGNHHPRGVVNPLASCFFVKNLDPRSTGKIVLLRRASPQGGQRVISAFSTFFVVVTPYCPPP